MYAVLGLFFAWCAQARVRVDGIWSQPTVTLVGVFTGVVVVPASLYLNLAYPDWSWLYMVDSRSVPGLAIVPLVAACAGAVAGGYYGGVRLVRGGKLKLVTGLLGGAAALLVVVIAMAGSRLAASGTYVGYHASPRQTVPLSSDKFGLIAIVAVTVGTLAAAAHIGWELWKDGKRATVR